MGCSHSPRQQHQKYHKKNGDISDKKDPEITERVQNLKPTIANIEASRSNIKITQELQPLKVSVSDVNTYSLKQSYKNFNYSQSFEQNFPIFIENMHPVPSELLQFNNLSEFSINTKNVEKPNPIYV